MDGGRTGRVRVAAVMLAAAAAFARAQDATVLRLWPEGAPGAVGTEESDIPTLTVSLPGNEKNTGTAIVICPGGGYGGLALDHEGKQIAEWCNSLGIAGCILRYRHAPKYRHPIPLGDAQRAIRTVRSKANEWHIQPDQIGIIGFSAGGHLASTTGTHFDAGKSDAPDPIDRLSSRPDFMILCYPVISFTESYTHTGSRKNLLGLGADPELFKLLSNEKQVTRQTPPTFLFHTNADTGVLPENSVAFYMALRAAKVPAEMHIYERGPHGVGLATKDDALKTWPDLCARWMALHGWTTPPKGPETK